MYPTQNPQNVPHTAHDLKAPHQKQTHTHTPKQTQAPKGSGKTLLLSVALEGSGQKHLDLIQVEATCIGPKLGLLGATVGAFIIRIEFWGPLYSNYNKEPPK